MELPILNATQRNETSDSGMRQKEENSMAQSGGGSRDRNHESSGFEARAHNAKSKAILVAALHKLSGVLGIMALTWATVVLLGGFVSDVSTWDFYLITSLLLAESSRLFIIQSFIKLVSRILYREKRKPQDFQFTDKQSDFASRLNFAGQASSGGVALVCLVLTISRLAKLGSSPFSSGEGPKHIVQSLWIFYITVILNSIIAVLSASLHLLFRPFRTIKDTSHRDKQETSLAAFYDKIYRTAIEQGTTVAGEIDLLDFTFQKIAGDLKRNIRPLIVRSLNKEMIKFMYTGAGIDMACQYLRGDDLWKRIAAANLPGFWNEEVNIEKKHELFWSLRDRVSSLADDGIASLNSVQSLARCWSLDNKGGDHPFLMNSAADDGGNVLDTVVNLLLTKRSSLLFKARAFAACCRDSRVLNYLYDEHARTSEQAMNRAEINGRLNELVVKKVTKDDLDVELGKDNRRKEQKVAGNDDRSASTLEKLCTTLAGAISPRSKNVIIFARIYSARALMLLLQHAQHTSECKAAKTLKNWVGSRIQPEPTIDKGGKIGYYVEADIVAAEKVRQWVGITEACNWSSMKVVDMDNWYTELRREEIEAIVSAARNLSSDS
ncbi:hypothetical protein KP509_18G015300 [Ceratopteris richardii]|uniref:Uncharacterized protein n=1 Tax=Ceratopteris richardii TaxID=49495 RepID=A0A8T2SMW4_CERRI|nr:hypothetical protein KP509_18G015300 [Ceratopteris richardii]